MKNIVVVAHKYLPQPDDDLVLYLNSKSFPNVLHVYHSFNDALDRRSYGVWYKFGKIHKKYKTRDYKKLPEFVIYLKESIFTILLILKLRINWDLFVGMDGLCVLFGNVLKIFKAVNKTIYWAIDFVPFGRFRNEQKNKVYASINKNSYKNADEVWDLSPRMAEARKKFSNLRKEDYRVLKVVPYGIWLDRIKRISFADCKKNTLVFMGHLIEKQGVQLIIKAIPELVKKKPEFEFKIIGEGNYKKLLIKEAKKLNVEKYCNFFGKINDNKKLEKEIAVSCLAVAPYIRKLDKWTMYADPGKVKTYLGCGIPVLLTDLPWNADQIKRFGCGEIISENKKDIANKIIMYMTEDINKKCRENAIKYAETFNWTTIFNKIFAGSNFK